MKTFNIYNNYIKYIKIIFSYYILFVLFLAAKYVFIDKNISTASTHYHMIITITIT